MTLKKTIASYMKEDGTWEPQQEVEMHPLEEEEVRAHWAINHCIAKIPAKPTKEEEQEWLIEHGPDFVKQKRAEWKQACDDFEPEIQMAHTKAQAAAKAWCDHVEHCHANGLDKDKHDKEAHAHIVEKYKDDEHSMQAKASMKAD